MISQPHLSGKPGTSHPTDADADVVGAGRVPLWRAGVGVEVQVVVSLATVLGLDEEPGLLRGYGAVPAETIRQIVDVAEASGAATRLRRLFCDPTDGRLLTMESRADYFTGGLRQFGCWRDQADRLTGGPVGDLDHIHDRAAGGATTAANAQALGVLNNRVIKNHPQVRARALPVPARGDGLDRYRRNAPDIEWTLPSGRTYLSTPPPALGPGSHPDQPQPSAPHPRRRRPRRRAHGRRAKSRRPVGRRAGARERRRRRASRRINRQRRTA